MSALDLGSLSLASTLAEVVDIYFDRDQAHTDEAPTLAAGANIIQLNWDDGAAVRLTLVSRTTTPGGVVPKPPAPYDLPGGEHPNNPPGEPVAPITGGF